MKLWLSGIDEYRELGHLPKDTNPFTLSILNSWKVELLSGAMEKSTVLATSGGDKKVYPLYPSRRRGG